MHIEQIYSSFIGLIFSIIDFVIFHQVVVVLYVVAEKQILLMVLYLSRKQLLQLPLSPKRSIGSISFY